MKQLALVLAALISATPIYAEDIPDSEADCLQAARLLLAELDKIDPEHGFSQRSLTQQLYAETSESGGGPYLCQAYILMSKDEGNSLEGIAMEYYAESGN